MNPGTNICMLPLNTISYRLLWAAFLGSAIGIERSARKRPAGMRTSLCVCMGAALLAFEPLQRRSFEMPFYRQHFNNDARTSHCGEDFPLLSLGNIGIELN